VEIELSKLIDILNERFGTEFKPGDQLFFDSICEDALADTNLRQAGRLREVRQPLGSSCPEPQAGYRAVYGHTAIPETDESPLAGQGLPLPHREWSMLSCINYIICC
jgi:hypothetical protein